MIERLLPKDPGEKILVSINFVDALMPGESVVSALPVAVDVVFGVDASPNATLGAASTLIGTRVQQYFIGGLRDVDYHLYTFADTDSAPSRRIKGEVIVPVR